MKPNPHRKLTRTTLRGLNRNRNRCCLRGRRRGPDDFSRALAAFRRALRLHRRLARLVPSYFDAAVVERERENRAAQRRWMASWEPDLARLYGVDPSPPPLDNAHPPLPSPGVQRQLNCLLVELQSWMAAGQSALEQYQRRHPQGLMSLNRIARLLEMSFALARMACGMDTPNRIPDKVTYDYELTDLKRAYGCMSGEQKEPDAGAVIPPVAVETPVQFVPEVPPVPSADLLPSLPPRCDAWSRAARQLRSRPCGVATTGAAPAQPVRPPSKFSPN